MLRLYGQSFPAEQVDPQQAAKFEDEAGRFWDLFYKRNSDRFFKDRHYFEKEWPQLTQGALTVLEVGCGAGNSVFPLLELNPQLRVYACDFSPRAVELVKGHPAYTATGRVEAFVADITQAEGPDALAQQLPGRVVDFCSMVFVLSAVAPHKMRQALRNVASVLKRGSGRVLFRDYAEGDLAQTRLQDSSSGVRHIRGNFYAQGDGTCCYYFDQAELSALMACEGFVCEASIIHARTIENRKSGVKMPRRWIQAVFRYDPDLVPPVQDPDALVLPQLQPPQPQPPSSPLPSQQQQQQQQHQQEEAAQMAAGAAHAGSSTVSFSCAGQTWLLPSAVADGHTSSSSSAGCARGCCLCLAEALSQLVAAQQLQVLGRVLLLAPEWLRLHKQQQQQQQQQVQQQALRNTLRVEQQQGARMPAVCCCAQGVSSSGDDGSSGSSSAAEAARQQGAAAALLSLVAVWLGARRVCVCWPDSSTEATMAAAAAAAGSLQDSISSSSRRELAVQCLDAFHAVLGLNECRVVVERIRPKRWQQDSARQAALLQQEVLGVLALPAAAAAGSSSSSSSGSSGLVVLGAAADSGCSCSANDSSTSHSNPHSGAQQLLEAVCGQAAAGLSQPMQLVLLP